MFSIIRPFLFNLDPETAHDFAIKSLKLNPLPSKMFEVEDEQMLNIQLFGKNFPNPIGLAAGFDKSAEVYNSLFRLGFGFVEVGTITPRKQLGNLKPRIFRLEKDKAMINRLGFNNDGAEIVSKRLSKNFPDKFIVSFGYTGWSSGQLEKEIQQGSWVIIPANEQIIFSTIIISCNK